MSKLAVGDPAPDFRSTTQDGLPLTLADLRGQPHDPLFLPQRQHFGLYEIGRAHV